MHTIKYHRSGQEKNSKNNRTTNASILFQVHREEGLELHLEMVSKRRGHAREGTKSAAMQEEMAALCSKLSATNARLVIAENTKAKLEQELASEK